MSAAQEQGRACLVLAFSGTSDLAELRLTQRGAGLDRRGLQRLLDFLACSFGGGTDVAGPARQEFTDGHSEV